MKVKHNNYPYPFLSNDNDHYVNSKFSAETVGVSFNESTDHFEIDIEVILENETIKELIQSGYVSLIIHAECRKTYYDKIFKMHDMAVKIQINKKLVTEKVELNALLIVNKKINYYANNDFHEDFKGYSFQLIPGNLLGAAPADDIYIENQIPKKIESIFILKYDSSLNPGEINVSHATNKIAIYLSKKDHKDYQLLQSNKQLYPVLYSLVVVPVLIETIHHINDEYLKSDGNEDMEDLDWFKSIREKLQELDIYYDAIDEIPSPLTTATKLINNPLEKSLEVLLESGDEFE